MPFSANLQRLKSQDKECLLPNLAMLLERVCKDLETDRDSAKSLLIRATTLVRVEIDRLATRGDSRMAGGLAGWQSRRLSLFINARLDQPIHVKELSAIVKLSTPYFSRAFKRTFDATPHAYIVERRIEKAETLMLTSDLSLSDIALHCGLTDQAHLCKLFRQKYGQSPGAWRRERTETGPKTKPGAQSPVSAGAF